jgi:DNA-directed RNA polymerase subunit RPC12/RpoP
MQKQSPESVIKSYKNGKEFTTISRKTNLPLNEVVTIIEEYKIANTIGEEITSPHQINDELADVIRTRYINEIPQTQIAKELDILLYPIRSICNKANSDLGSKASFEDKYTLIENVTNLNECPHCTNKRLHKFETLIERRDVEGMYCERCSNEYFKLVEKAQKNEEEKDEEENEETDKEAGKAEDIVKVYKINFEYID